MPGIIDNATSTFEEDAVIDRNLRWLKNELSKGGFYVIFFVVAPRNGRIDSKGLALMQLVLNNLREGPLVGLIITQIHEDDLIDVQNPDYYAAVLETFKRARAKTRFLDCDPPLVLRKHSDVEGFSPQDLFDIENYVLGFTPGKVVIHNMVVKAFHIILKAIVAAIAHHI
jgi:hypothetical protein